MEVIGDMSFGLLLTIVAGGLTIISLGIMIVIVNILKSFQKD